MNQTDHALTQFFYTILTNPTAAETLLHNYPEHEQKMLQITATQNSILLKYATRPKPAQVRPLVAHMRKIFSEPIDSYAVTTLIDATFAFHDTPVQRRFDALNPTTKNRMQHLLPHAIYTEIQPSPNDTHNWVTTSAEHYTSALQALTEEFGPDFGGYYRIVCSSPETATDYLNNATITPEHKHDMVTHTAHAAIHHLFPQGPTTAGRQRLLHHLHTHYGDFPTELLDQIIDHAYTPNQPDFTPNTTTYELAIHLPSAMAALNKMTSFDIGDFARKCYKNTANRPTPHKNTKDH